MPGVLADIRVIDFGQYVAGPLAAMLLADQGADVIRVEPPGGPRWQTPVNATWNRGKRSIVLDLKADGDRRRARRLVESADVLVENFRPGVMERLGLGSDEMLAANPRLVYCSLPGFASDDPRAATAAWEGVVSAAAAWYRGPAHVGEAAKSGPARPVYSAVPVASAYAAVQGAVAVAMALNARERDGLGQRIEVPLFDASYPRTGVWGLSAQDPSTIAPSLAVLWSGAFACRDGRWVYFVGAGNQNLSQFVKAAAIESWIAEGFLDLRRVYFDRAMKQELQERLDGLFRTRTAQEWEDLIAEAGSECGVCRTSPEWLTHPHALGSAMAIDVEDPVLGMVRQPGINARLSGTPGGVRSPAPRPGQHNDEVLAGLDGRPAAPTPHPAETLRSALQNVRVLELCYVLAGPTVGRTLAEYGADVIKIVSPSHAAPDMSYLDTNRGKRSMVLDLKSEQGREVVQRLLETADGLTQNFRLGKLERLGLGYEQVRARKPSIVYGSFNAFGHAGPWATRPGHEQIAQAITGMMLRFGGDGRPRLQPDPVNDYATGFLGAYAMALGLLHARRTGEGQLVDTALAYTAMTLQSPFMQQYQGKCWDEPRGQESLGSGPLHRAYEAVDGWLFLGARAADLPRLAAVVGRAGAEGLRSEDRERHLELAFRTDKVDVWVERLLAAGIGAHRVLMSTAELMANRWAIEHGLSVTREHEAIGPLTHCGPAPRLSRTPVNVGHATAPAGTDALSILEEIGLAGRLDEYVRSGVVRL